MKFVIWTDKHGFNHRSLIRNSDPDDKAPELGILVDPPDLSGLDFTQLPGINTLEFKRKLHNRLIQLHLITWQDVQQSQNGLTSALMAVGRDRKTLVALKRQLVMLYRQ